MGLAYYYRNREKCLEGDKERRDWYSAHGICIACGHNEAVPGLRRCGDCLYRAREHWYANHTPEENRDYQREKYARYRAEGRCVKCGQPAVEGMCMCESCQKKHNRAGRRWKREHQVSRDPQLCRIRECREKAVEGRVWCEAHLEMWRENMRKNREKGNNQNHPWRKDEQARQKTEKWRRNGS